jgi:hypothetical protein
VVPLDATVTNPPISFGHHPGNGSLDHGAPLPVVVGETRRDSTSARSLGLRRNALPSTLVVQRSRCGQLRQSDPKVAAPFFVIETVCPFGQVAVFAS